MAKLAVWADGTQARLSDLEEYLEFMSDDYCILTYQELEEIELAYYQMRNEDADNDGGYTF